MDLELVGKTALVCGGSQGIGAACAMELASLGSHVIVLARSEDKLMALCQQLPQNGNQDHSYIAIDTADRVGLEQQVESQLTQYKSIEILINNSGGPKAGPITQAEEIEFSQGFQNHILVNSLLAKKLLPQMQAQQYGRIINIISTSVKIPIPNLGVSNTIRAAVAAWGKSLANEVGQYGITVNSVLPGFTKTSRLDNLIAASAERLNKSNDEIIAGWKQTIPAARFAQPKEIAAAVGFLASPAAAYINGITLPVDGGRTGCI